MKNNITLAEAEKLLESSYLMKYVYFTYPGYPTVAGRVDRIGIDTSKPEPMVFIMINDKRYICSIQNLKSCLKLIDNGNTC